MRARLPRHARTHLCKAKKADDGILLIHPPRPMLPAGPARVRARVRARARVGITVAVGLAAMLRVLRHHSTHERPHVRGRTTQQRRSIALGVFADGGLSAASPH